MTGIKLHPLISIIFHSLAFDIKFLCWQIPALKVQFRYVETYSQNVVSYP